jgi:hypothetical protein
MHRCVPIFLRPLGNSASFPGKIEVHYRQSISIIIGRVWASSLLLMGVSSHVARLFVDDVQTGD